MTLIEAHVECPVRESFNVQQVAGLFDVPLAARATATFCADVPSGDEDWKIGLIVGPSGSGKSVIAREAFGEAVYRPQEWPADRAVVDGFGDLPMREVTALLTAVGFSSPPSWIKPYHVLSGGERFRCDLARALAGLRQEGAPQIVAFDEFTSVVDRTVAQIGSAAVSRALRGGRLAGRFVAVTCHYDVAEWLEPDWVVDMATRECQRRRLRRPEIRVAIVRCRHAAWQLFARHHYLSGQLSRSARCFLAVWQKRATEGSMEEIPVAFCATIPLIGRRGRWRITRIVTLPDYQGIGIGMRVAEVVAALHREEGLRINVTASHPALVAHCRRSPAWRTVSFRPAGSRSARQFIANYRGSTGRAVASFEYVGHAQ